MTLIKVPKPPGSALDKGRPISSLLKTQVEHLQEAEFRLPAQAQTNIYINAIKTEGEAAEYIRKVTARLHEQHAGSAIKTSSTRKEPKVAASLEIAAAAGTKSRSKRKAVKKSAKRTPRTRAKRGMK
jgi:hypothetical protein